MLLLSFLQLMGTSLSAKARIQINLAVSQVVDIKQVATFPDIIFPIIWFEEVSNKTSKLWCFVNNKFCLNIWSLLYSTFFIYTVIFPSGHRWSSRRNDQPDETGDQCSSSCPRRHQCRSLRFRSFASINCCVETRQGCQQAKLTPSGNWPHSTAATVQRCTHEQR